MAFRTGKFVQLMSDAEVSVALHKKVIRQSTLSSPQAVTYQVAVQQALVAGTVQTWVPPCPTLAFSTLACPIPVDTLMVKNLSMTVAIAILKQDYAKI